jgi:splicing factor 4
MCNRTYARLCATLRVHACMPAVSARGGAAAAAVAGSGVGSASAAAGAAAEGDDAFDSYRKRMMLAYKFRPNPLNNPRRSYY